MNFKKLLLTTLAALCLAQPAQAMNKELLTKAYGIGKEVLQKHPGKAAIALWVAALLLPKRSPKVLSKALMLAGTGLLVYEYPKTTLTAGGLFIAAALIISYKIVTINARLKIKRLENNLETHKDIDDDINIDESFKDNVKSNNETQKINVQQQNLTISTNNESLKNDVVEEIKKVWSNYVPDVSKNIDGYADDVVDAVNAILQRCIQNQTIMQTLDYNNQELSTWSENMVTAQQIVGNRYQSACCLRDLIDNTYMLHGKNNPKLFKVWQEKHKKLEKKIEVHYDF